MASLNGKLRRKFRSKIEPEDLDELLYRFVSLVKT